MRDAENQSGVIFRLLIGIKKFTWFWAGPLSSWFMGLSHGSSLSDFRSVLSQPILLLRDIVRIKYKDQVLYILEFLKKKMEYKSD